MKIRKTDLPFIQQQVQQIDKAFVEHIQRHDPASFHTRFRISQLTIHPDYKAAMEQHPTVQGILAFEHMGVA